MPFQKTVCSLLLAFVLIGCSDQAAENANLIARWKHGTLDRATFETFLTQRGESTPSSTDPTSNQEWTRSWIEAYVADQELARLAESESIDRKGNVFKPSVFERSLIETMRARLTASPTVTDAEIEAFYQQNPEEFGHPDRIRLHHIFRRYSVSPSAAEKQAVQMEMDQILSRLRQGENFEEMAKKYSDSETAHTGGLIGRLDRGQMDPSIENIVWELPEGALSDLVPTPVGVHIFKVTTKIPAFRMPLEEARNRIRRRLEGERTSESLGDLFESLIQESGASYQPEMLRDQPEQVVFQIDDLSLSSSEFLESVRTQGFFEQRDQPLENQLEAVVFDQLLLWKAGQENLESDPDLAGHLEGIQQSERFAVAARQFLQTQIDTSLTAELEQYFRDHEDQYKTPQLYRLTLLTLPFPETERPMDNLDTLRRLAEAIEQGTSKLEDEARSRSLDLSASQGGDVGWIRLDAFGDWAGPQAQKVIEKLEVGELSPPFLIENYDRDQLKYTRAGFGLARLEDTRAPSVRAFEEVRLEVAQQWIQNQGQTMEEWMKEKLLENADLEILN